MKRRISGLLFVVMLLGLLMGIAVPTATAAAYDWVIYWYLCGSDLETDNAAATMDLYEAFDVELPDNVKIVIQTGGAEQWHNDFVDEEYTYRLTYTSEGLAIEDALPVENMGEQNTLVDFLTYCETEHPGARKGFVFWDHGGGHVGGICNDQNFDDDSLSLAEVYTGLREVYEENPEAPPLELVGFDACLMATLETATTFRGIANYFVASEEVEPGVGWAYEGIMGALVADQSMDGAELGKVICDTYYQGCEDNGLEQEITLSCIDVNKLTPLVHAVNNMGMEGLARASDDAVQFFGSYARGAKSAQNYQADSGFELVDLGGLVSANADLFPDTADSLLSALDDAVVYKVNGSYRDQATGISCYYPFHGHGTGFDNHTAVTDTPAYGLMTKFMMAGTVTDDEYDYIQQAWAEGYQEYDEFSEYEEEEPQDDEDDGDQSNIGAFFGSFAQAPLQDGIAPMAALSIDELADHPVEIDEDNMAVLNIGSDYADQLSSVNFLLACVQDGDMLFLGQDNDINPDWDNGVFTDNFRGVWGGIDGRLVYMRVEFECEEYVLYSVPLMINSDRYDLSICYDYERETYQILTATPDMTNSDYGAKTKYILRPGDEITTLHLFMDSGEADFTWYEVDTFTFAEDSEFSEYPLDEGDYLFMFDMIDFRNESVQSDAVHVQIDAEGEISVEAI